MTKIPNKGIWTQSNKSDKFGTIVASKNIDLDEQGYVKLSPRAVALISEAEVANHGTPVAYGFNSLTNDEGTGINYVTDQEEHTALISTIIIDIDEDDNGTKNPNITTNSHGVFYNKLWLASEATLISSRGPGTDQGALWTEQISANVTTGLNHFMTIFENRDTLCVANGNKVQQFDADYTQNAVTHVVIPAEFAITKLAHAGQWLGILAQPTAGGLTLNKESSFFLWNGDNTKPNDGAIGAANFDYPLGSFGSIGLHSYQGSFVVITMDGQFKFYTGGGMKTIAALPFRNVNTKLRKDATINHIGSNMTVEGEVLFANLSNDLDLRGIKGERQAANSPSGVWALGEAGNLYHRLSPSLSQVTVATVTQANVNISTELLTCTIGGTHDLGPGSFVVPATGNIARYTNSSGTDIGGLDLYKDYYIIYVSDTTFKLATTKENALLGNAINLTSTGGANHYFHLYNIVDYGQTYFTQAGAVSSFLDLNPIHDRFMFGNTLFDTTLTERGVNCMTVPELENRGYFVTPKIFSRNKTDLNEQLVVKFRPLKASDTVVVKQKTFEVQGLPVTAPQDTFASDEAEWTNDSEFFTSSDLSNAKTAITAGVELECEIVAGVGAGQSSKIKEINSNDGTYSLVLEDDIIGATGGLKSYFIIDNWRFLATITSADNDKGFVEIPARNEHKWAQFKIEMRGSDIAIEELDLISQTDRPSV